MLNQKKQQGVVLFVGMVIMLVMAMVVLSAGKNSALQGKMTASVRDSQAAINAIEHAFTAGENYVDSLVSVGDFNDVGNNGLYANGASPADPFDAANWAGSKFRTVTDANGVTAQYYIVDMGKSSAVEDDFSTIQILGYGQTTGSGDVNVFKIVARSTGRSATAERIAMVFFGKRL